MEFTCPGHVPSNSHKIFYHFEFFLEFYFQFQKKFKHCLHGSFSHRFHYAASMIYGRNEKYFLTFTNIFRKDCEQLGGGRAEVACVRSLVKLEEAAPATVESRRAAPVVLEEVMQRIQGPDMVADVPDVQL